jgi:hypothetical protein
MVHSLLVVTLPPGLLSAVAAPSQGRSSLGGQFAGGPAEPLGRIPAYLSAGTWVADSKVCPVTRAVSPNPPGSYRHLGTHGERT